MAVVLRTGNQTSLTICNLQDGIYEGADGVKQALVKLPETGEYFIEIGTDATAIYKLKLRFTKQIKVRKTVMNSQTQKGATEFI